MSYTPWVSKDSLPDWVQPTITPGVKPAWVDYSQLNDWAAIKNVSLSQTLDDFENTVDPSDFSPDGTLYAVGDLSGNVTIFDTTTWSVVETLTEAGSSQIQAVKFSPDGAILAVGISAGTLNPELRIYDTSDWSVEEEITTNRQSCSGLSFYYGGSTPLLATASTHSSLQLVVYNTDTWSVEQSTSTSGLGRRVDFSPDGSELALSRWDGVVIIFETNTWSVDKTISDSTGIMSCKYSPNGDFLATGSIGDSTVRIYETPTYSLIETLTEPANEVRDLNFSPDGRLLIAGGRGTFTQIYYTETWQVDKIVNAPATTVFTVGFSPDNKLAYIGGSGNIITLYDIEQYQTNDQVLHIGQVWRSDTDDNLSEPPTDWTDIGYKVNDQVEHLGDIWIAQTDDTLQEPGVGSDWLLGVPFYNQGDTVQHVGQQWESEIDENFDEPPTNWTDFSYQEGEEYSHNGALWQVATTGTLDEPSLASNDWVKIRDLIVNENTNASLLTNLNSNETGIINAQTSYDTQGLWVASVQPWELDLPWQYEAIITNTTTLTNLV